MLICIQYENNYTNIVLKTNTFQKMFEKIDVLLNRVKTALHAKNDAELAELLKIHRSTLSGWRNRNTADLFSILKICNEAGVNLQWLLTGVGKMYNSARRFEDVISQDVESYIQAGKVSEDVLQLFKNQLLDGFEKSKEYYEKYPVEYNYYSGLSKDDVRASIIDVMFNGDPEISESREQGLAVFNFNEIKEIRSAIRRDLEEKIQSLTSEHALQIQAITEEKAALTARIENLQSQIDILRAVITDLKK